MTTSEPPTACTLNDQDAEAQALQWVELQGLATEITSVESGVAMRLPAAHAPAVLDLAERESACCSFLNIAATVEADECVVEITADTADALGLIGLLTGLDAT